uniref:BZIP domain-containing protein n=1 Tax=Oryza brachyantha TaxID=4533 RepID=J3LHF1_ORYBR
MDFPGGSGRPQQQQLPPMTPLPLARQGSVYSLTFDEFQSTLGGVGKDFGSMNMDELLRSIWTAEESHAGGGGVAPLVSPVRPVSSNGFGKMEGGDLSSLSPSPVPYIFNGGLRGRKAPGIEKVVERRQRRMIKNRESAARSRQRKQAYMMELEAEVAKLKELNEELQKKQDEILEQQKNEGFGGCI